MQKWCISFVSLSCCLTRAQNKTANLAFYNTAKCSPVERRTWSRIMLTSNRRFPLRLSMHSFWSLETQGLILVMSQSVRSRYVRAVRLQRDSEAWIGDMQAIYYLQLLQFTTSTLLQLHCWQGTKTWCTGMHTGACLHIFPVLDEQKLVK